MSNMSAENVSGQFQISQLNSVVVKSTLIPTIVYLCILLTIGIPGNSLVCYIYHFRIRNRELSSNIFILALSWFDLINCAISLPTEIKFVVNFVQFDEATLCKLSRFLTFFCNNASSVILLAIAIDRLVAFLSGPVRRRLSPNMSKGIVLLAILISGSISWPMLIFFGTFTWPLKNGLVLKTCSIVNSYRNSSEVAVFTISLLIVHIMFDVAFLVIYSVIGKRICYDIGVIASQTRNGNHIDSVKLQIRKESFSSNDDVFTSHVDIPKSRSTSPCRIKFNFLSQESKNHNEFLLHNVNSLTTSPTTTSSDEGNILNKTVSKISNCYGQLQPQLSKRRQSPSPSECKIFNRRGTANRTSFMLFIVTLAYVISFMPYCVIVVLRHVTKPSFYSKLSNIEKAMYELFLRSYALSSAINPLIYSLINASFRKRCKQAFMDLLHYVRERKKQINEL